MGKVRKEKPAEDYIPLVDRILDSRLGEVVAGYDLTHRIVQSVVFLDKVEFNATVGVWTSQEFFCAPYSVMALLVDIDWTLTVTDLTVVCQTSDDPSKWYKKVDGPWGSLIWVPAQGDLRESVDGDVRANWIRLVVTVVGSTAVNKALLTAKIIFCTV